jgi:hypothetical protein
MRSLLLLLLLISSPVYAIVVTGEGFTFEDAKQQAFKKAVEKEVGVIVDSERIVVEQDLISNQILTYSGGYVTSYTLIEHYPIGELQYVKLDVTVASSKLKDFILLQPHEILDFDGSQFKEIISSYKQQAIDADALVDNFLKYYPHEAFLITADEYVVMTDPYRNSYIEIPYTIQWNDEFLYALEEISGLVGSRDPVLKVPKIVLKNRSVYYFYDKITFGNINKAFDNTEYIRITVINSINETLLNTCVQSIKYSGITGASLDRYSVMYSNSGYDLIIKGNKQVSNIARIDLTDDLVNLIDNQVKIKLSVISIDLCYE